MKATPKLLRSAYLLAALSPAALNAQTATTQAPPLDTTVVTASRLPQLVTEAIPTTTVLTRKDIEQSGAIDLPTLLTQQTGVEFGRNGGFGQSTSAFMRGAASNHTLVLLDGVPMNTESFATASIEALNLAQIERIEVVRGNVSALYGSNAVGGVIAIFSRANANKNYREASAELGQHGRQKLSLSVSQQLGQSRLSLSLNQTREGGVSNMNSLEYSSTNPDDDTVKQRGVQLGFSTQITPDLKLNISTLLNKTAGDYDSDNLFGGAATDLNTFKSQQTQHRLSADWQVRSGWAMQAIAAKFNETRQFHLNGTLGDFYTTERSFLSLQNTFSLSAQQQLFATLERDDLRLDQSSFGSPLAHERTGTAALLGYKGTFGALSAQAHLRHDQMDGAGKANTYFAGMAYALNPQWTVRASQATAFNRPTPSQLFDPFSGNTALTPERAHNRELGLQFVNKALHLRLTMFQSRSSNGFGYDSMTFQTINVKRTRNQGAELSAEYKLASGLAVHTSLNSHQPEEAGDGVTFSPALRRSKFAASAGLRQQLGAWRWGAIAKHNRSRADYDASFAITQLKPYTRIDLDMGYNFSPSLSLSAHLLNVGNAKDNSVFGYSAQPRSLFIKLTGQF